MRRFSITLAAILFYGLALASKPVPTNLSLDQTTPQELLVFVNGFATKIERVPQSEQKFLANRITDLQTTLESIQDWTTIDEKKKVALVNQYEMIRATLGNAEAKRGRKTCQRVTRVGSHMATTVCLTADERDAIRKKAERNLESVRRKNTSPLYRPDGN